MTFSDVTYKYNGIEEAKALTSVVEQKLQTLAKFSSESSPAAYEIEFEKVSEHQHGKIYRVEINRSQGGILCRAEATEHSFEEALDEVRDELDSELSRAKDKRDTLSKRAGRALKSLLSRG